MDDYRDVRDAKEKRLKKAFVEANQELKWSADYAVAYSQLRKAVEDFLFNAY